jgi:hypothetical protein
MAWHARAKPQKPAGRGIAAKAAARLLRGVLNAGATLRRGHSQTAVKR